ncbi:MAG: efflux RND transporter periplasmic adaptor subunit [Deltaproteobacteria bacterium]|nr:efflux RND transporter periplasmic adaptor subunit [Deltaproteobacteria bacterium]
MSKSTRVLRIVIFCLIAVVLVVGGVLIVRNKKKELAKTPPPARPLMAVNTAVIQSGNLADTRKYLGILRARVSGQVSSQLAARIISIRVREGEVVKKGRIVAVLDSRIQRDKEKSLAAQVDAARTALATYEGIYHRDLVLYQNKGLSKEALDRSDMARAAAESRLKALESSLRTARVELSYTRLAAPYDALVTKRLMEPGDIALPGKPLLAIDALDKGYKLLVTLPQDIFPVLKAGDPVRIVAGAGTQGAVQTAISSLYPAGSAGLLPVCEVDLVARPFGLPAGSSLGVVFTVARGRGFIVPQRAVLHEASGNFVFVVDNNQAVRIVPVHMLVQNPDRACVKGDLAAGQKVVVAGEDVLLRLHQGRKVRPVSLAGPAGTGR